MATIQIQATDGAGSFNAFVAEPRTKPAGVVVMIQEIFGVNEAMRKACEEYADLGFITICPDLFWRLEPGVDITDKTEAEWKKALDLLNRFDQAKGVEDLIATLAVARKMPGSNGRAGTVGYCLGGRLAFLMAMRSDADVNVSYYGVGLDGLMDEIGEVHAPLIVHIAEQDEFFPAEGRQKVLAGVKANPQVHAYTYPGANHAFARIGGTHWDARSATIANGRTTEALVAALG